MTCLMVDVEGLELVHNDIKRIEHSLVGGIILFSRNFKDKAQLKDLVISIRNVKHNLLIAVDHEGGRVQRFKNEFTSIPKMHALVKFTKKIKIMRVKLLN